MQNAVHGIDDGHVDAFTSRNVMNGFGGFHAFHYLPNVGGGFVHAFAGG